MKTLKIILIILLVITIGELVFYFYYQKLSSKSIKNFSSSKKLVKDTIEAEGLTPYEYWLTRKKPVMISSTRIDEAEGVITEIDTKGGLININGRSLPFALKITLNRNGSSFDFVYDENEIKKIKFLAEDDPKIQISEKDLKAGNNINIKETVNMLDSTIPIIDVVITK